MDRLPLPRWDPSPGVTCDPGIMGGLPCVTGTRIPVHAIADLVEQGEPLDVIAWMYDLTAEQVEQALAAA